MAEEYCAEGFIPAENNGSYGVEEGAYVARVDGVGYKTLEEALAADGTEIVLLDKVTVEGTQTWDLTGKTLTTYAVDGNYSVVVKGDLTIEGGTFNVNGVYGIGVNGKLTVKGGTFNAAEQNDYLIGNWGTTVIEGGEFNGIYNCVNNFAGTTTITGGSFTTEDYDCTGEYESEDILADSGLTVSGGTFSKPVAEEYCAEGFIPAENNGSYGVKVDDSKAKFNGQYYTSLQDALTDAATNGGVVYLTNTVEVENLEVPRGVTLDLNGNKLILTNSDGYISAYTKDRHIIDSSAAKTGRVVADIANLELYADNAYLPVKMNDGIMFVQAASGHSKPKAEVFYQSWINSADAALIEALQANSASGLALSFQVKLAWGADEENKTELVYTFKDATVAKYMENWETWAMRLTVNGAEKVENLQYQSRIVFAAGTDGEVVLQTSDWVAHN